MKGNNYWIRHSNNNGPVKLHPYLSVGDLAKFRSLREAGKITIFHVSKCETCSTEIPTAEGLRFCSRICFDKFMQRQ